MSKPKTIMIDDVEYIRADSVQKQMAEKDGLKFCIVRCHDAGVHAGYVESVKDRTVRLLDSRRLWRWRQMTLSELAVDGSLDEDNSKYACVVPAIDLLEACEVIECTKAGQESVYGVKVWTK